VETATHLASKPNLLHMTKSATALPLSLFPQSFVFERISKADIVFLLSDRVDDKFGNDCVIRSADRAVTRIQIPVCNRRAPVDDVVVSPDRSTWQSALEAEVRRVYRGLPFASAATELVTKSMSYTSEWLLDYLMHAFVMTLEQLDWRKKLVRGSVVERRQFGDAADYLLYLGLKNDCDRVILGADQAKKYRGRFSAKSVTVVSQNWEGTPLLSPRDSILDAIARYSVKDILKEMDKQH